MFKIFYTTQMSSSARQLQARFTKMRSKSGRMSKIIALIMAVAIIMVMATATVVMAAVGTDGLEYWQNDEFYYLAGVSGKVNTDINNAPDWVKKISSDGELDILVKRVDERAASYGRVTHRRRVELNGDKGNIEFVQKSTCGYYGENEEYMLLVFDRSESGEIDTDGMYVKFFENYYNQKYGGMDFEFFFDELKLDGFIRVTDAKQIGDFASADGIFNNEIQINYYTAYEQSFRNRKVDGVNLSVVSAHSDAVTVKIDVNKPQMEKIQILVCEPYIIPMTGSTKSYNLSEVNGTQMRIENLFPPNVYEKGKVYTVNYVLMDNDERVLYRQQDYISIE